MIPGPAWREEPVGRHHDRKRFDCGSSDLNDYLSRYARQNHESGGAKTFVAVPLTGPARVLGYHSISVLQWVVGIQSAVLLAVALRVFGLI